MFGCWDDNNLGYNPYYGGLAVMPDGRCYQGGIEVSCIDEDPYAGGGVPEFQGGPTSQQCPPGQTLVSGKCVPVAYDPLPPIGIYPGTPAPPVTATTPGLPPGRTWDDWRACKAYESKYRTVFGRDPVNLWCSSIPGPPPTIPTPPVATPPVTVTTITPPPPLSAGPTYPGLPRRRRRRRGWQGRPQPRIVPQVPAADAGGELCPARGWVSRPIPGVNEYQVVACTPGAPVVINQGLATVVRREALARQGLSGLGDLGDFTVGNVIIPTWALVASAAAAAFLLLGKRRR